MNNNIIDFSDRIKSVDDVNSAELVAQFETNQHASELAKYADSLQENGYTKTISKAFIDYFDGLQLRLAMAMALPDTQFAVNNTTEHEDVDEITAEVVPGYMDEATFHITFACGDIGAHSFDIESRIFVSMDNSMLFTIPDSLTDLTEDAVRIAHNSPSVLKAWNHVLLTAALMKMEAAILDSNGRILSSDYSISISVSSPHPSLKSELHLDANLLPVDLTFDEEIPYYLQRGIKIPTLETSVLSQTDISNILLNAGPAECSKAFDQLVSEEDVVIDLTDSWGLHAVQASRAGAKKVVAVRNDQAMRNFIFDLFDLNRCHGDEVFREGYNTSNKCDLKTTDLEPRGFLLEVFVGLQNLVHQLEGTAIIASPENFAHIATNVDMSTMSFVIIPLSEAIAQEDRKSLLTMALNALMPSGKMIDLSLSNDNMLVFH